MITLAAIVAMGTVIAFSFYMVRHTRGRMSEAFKIILLGHSVVLLFDIAKVASAFLGYEMSPLKVVFMEQTAQVISALSIFIALYMIRQSSFHRAEGTHDE